MGSKLPANADIVVQIHYPYGSTGQVDSTKINFEFSDTPTREVKAVPFINHVISITNGPLHIPADSVKTFYAQQTIPVELTLLSISPHAHLICEYMKAFAVTPNGDTIKFVEIPNWDFHWQGAYFFPQPIRLPAGSTIYGEARYNNTISNPNNPNFPAQAVNVGEATTDEMLIFYFTYLPYQSGDENIMVDEPGSHQPHYQDCATGAIGINEKEASSGKVIIVPNPSSENTTIYYHDGTIVSYELMDMQGRVIANNQTKNAGHAIQLQTNTLAKGSYFIRVFSEDGFAVEKLIVN